MMKNKHTVLSLILLLTLILLFYLIKEKIVKNFIVKNNEQDNLLLDDIEENLNERKLIQLKRKKFIEKEILEYPNKCNKFHVFVMKPSILSNDNNNIDDNDNDNDDDDDDDDNCLCDDKKLDKKINNDVNLVNKMSSSSSSNLCHKKQQQQQQREDNNLLNKNCNDKNEMKNKKKKRKTTIITTTTTTMTTAATKTNINTNDCSCDISKSKSSNSKTGSNSKIMDNQNNQHVNQTSNPIIYMFVLFLIGSLIKATIDFSRQFKKVAPGNDDFSRRCSLQEYASRHNRTNSKKITRRSSNNIVATTIPVLPPKTIINTTIGCPTIIKRDNPRFSQLTRNMSLNYNYSTESEPGSPAKCGKLFGARPNPLTRRSSFPALSQQFLYNNIGKSRRPSMDSFSEGDSSSPDVKRRDSKVTDVDV